MSVALTEVTMHTDGSCRGNPGPGGYGVVLTSGPHRLELSGGYQHTTNNRMEILAAIVGLERLKKPSKVTIWSDSQYLVNAMTQGWLQAWKKRHWVKKSKEPVKNADLWARLDDATAPHEITWKWLRGHAGHPENERCDELATAAAAGNALLVDSGFEG